MLLDMVDLGRRLRAARELAGLRSVEALAKVLDEPGLGVSTLRAIEQGTREARNMELRAIAEACGVPYDFFTTDVADLAGHNRALDVKLDTVTERLAHLETLMLRVSNKVGLLINYYAAAGERTDPQAASAVEAMGQFAEELPELLADLPERSPEATPDRRRAAPERRPGESRRAS